MKHSKYSVIVVGSGISGLYAGLKLADMIKNNKLYNKDIETLWKCLNCGHEETLKKAWKKCPLCTKDQGYVKINL